MIQLLLSRLLLTVASSRWELQLRAQTTAKLSHVKRVQTPASFPTQSLWPIAQRPSRCPSIGEQRSMEQYGTKRSLSVQSQSKSILNNQPSKQPRPDAPNVSALSQSPRRTSPRGRKYSLRSCSKTDQRSSRPGNMDASRYHPKRPRYERVEPRQGKRTRSAQRSRRR